MLWGTRDVRARCARWRIARCRTTKHARWQARCIAIGQLSVSAHRTAHIRARAWSSGTRAARPGRDRGRPHAVGANLQRRHIGQVRRGQGEPVPPAIVATNRLSACSACGSVSAWRRGGALSQVRRGRDAGGRSGPLRWLARHRRVGQNVRRARPEVCGAPTRLCAAGVLDVARRVGSIDRARARIRRAPRSSRPPRRRLATMRPTPLTRTSPCTSTSPPTPRRSGQSGGRERLTGALRARGPKRTVGGRQSPPPPRHARHATPRARVCHTSRPLTLATEYTQRAHTRAPPHGEPHRPRSARRLDVAFARLIRPLVDRTV